MVFIFSASWTNGHSFQYVISNLTSPIRTNTPALAGTPVALRNNLAAHTPHDAVVRAENTSRAVHDARRIIPRRPRRQLNSVIYPGRA